MHRLSSLLRRGGVLGLALLLVLLITWSASAAGSTTVFLPFVSRQVIPRYDSTSYYVQTTDSVKAYDRGVQLGQADAKLSSMQDRLVILDFGQPWYENGQFGTIVFRVGGVGEFIFADMTRIADMAKNFALGYWVGTGKNNALQLTLGIGTSNYLRADMVNTNNAYQHGKLWAQMVIDVNSWLKSQGYAGQVYAAGANDMELSWATPGLTRAWVNGFNAADNDSAIYYNYGACEGCPQSYYSSYSQWQGVNGWTPDDIWYISWGVQPAWVVPEIYLSSGANAKQWQTLSKYSASTKGTAILFQGAMTQYGACLQRGGCTSSSSSVDTMNTPQEGGTQLWDYLNKDPATSINYLRWLTDIRYWTN